jgi:hypothetical protein
LFIRPSSAVTNAINSLNGNTNTNNKLSEEEKKRIVDEEAKTLEAFKVHLFVFYL